MKLLVTKSTKNKVVTLELETIAFTKQETDMLEQLGEPVIAFEKMYGNNSIRFAKKIRSNFRVKVKFDANLDSNTDTTADHIEAFLDDIKEAIESAMEKLSDEYNRELIPTTQVFEIKY